MQPTLWWGLFVVLLCAGCKDDSPSQSLAVAASAPAAASGLMAQTQGLVAQSQELMAQSQTTVSGAVHSVGGELGTWDTALTDCQSGEYNGFYGVDFYAEGSDRLRVRYVHDEAAGEVVKVAVPSKPGTVIVFDRDAKCSILEGSVEKTNFTSWTSKGNIRHLKGQVKFDCENTGGKGHVTGSATFSHCH